MDYDQKIFVDCQKHGSVPCFLFKQCGSTNVEAKILSASVARPFGVMAESQTAGRGRFDRTFLSAKNKGVYLSVALDVKDVSLAPRLGCACALAVGKSLERYGVDYSFKWPNDVLVGGKKICGILCESLVCGSDCTAILGIGVNIAYNAEDFGDLADKAVSLYQVIGRGADVTEFGKNLLCDVLCETERVLCAESLGRFRLKCDTVGKRIEYYRDGIKTIGTATGIGEDMSLVIDEKFCLNYGEVTIVK